MYCILSIKKEEKLKRQTLRKETKWDVKCMKFIVIDIRQKVEREGEREEKMMISSLSKNINKRE